MKWFYAFSIAPVTSSSTAIARPANATKNPFTQIVRPLKRPIEDSEGENFIWGSVRQPGKRSRIGEPRECGFYGYFDSSVVAQGEPGKPPPGYKCRRCDSTEVCGFVELWFLLCVQTISCQHFINECPKRTKPPEGYVCKICSTVSATRFLLCHHVLT